MAEYHRSPHMKTEKQTISACDKTDSESIAYCENLVHSYKRIGTVVGVVRSE
jgi:hypothetical protein